MINGRLLGEYFSGSIFSRVFFSQDFFTETFSPTFDTRVVVDFGVQCICYTIHLYSILQNTIYTFVFIPHRIKTIRVYVLNRKNAAVSIVFETSHRKL